MPIERPSDRWYPCFFCFDAKVKSKTDSCPHCGNPIDLGPLLEGQMIDGYILRSHIARGYYGVTFRGENRIGVSFAIKLVPSKLYKQHDKSFVDEISRYRQLGHHPCIAELLDAGEMELSVLGITTHYYFIVMEWVDGFTLKQYLDVGEVDINEIFGAILDIASALERFEKKNLWHNDLNSDNILFKELTDEERPTRKVNTKYICKVVDTGSAVFRQERPPGRLGDLAYVGHHINDLRKAALASDQLLTREDQFFLHSLERLVARLLDEAPTRAFTSAEELLREVDALYQQRWLLNEESEIKLQDPFAYLNANDFPNEAFINYLFSGLFPWVRDIVTPEAQGTLVTGPRGSGKTMILRSMRFKTRLHPFSPTETISSIRARVSEDTELAFFVSARIEIGNHCSLSKLPRWASSEELVVYYFLLLYAVEVLETLYYGLAKGILEIDRASEARFSLFMSSALGLRASQTLSAALGEVRVKQYAIERDSLGGVPKDVVLGAVFLSELAKNLRELSPLAANKSIIFLLDDFSLPKVPAEIQRILLPLIWNSGGGYSFRVSAHSESVVLEDLRRNQYQVNREFREINLGAAYLNSIDISRNEKAIEAYVGDIFGRRFNVSDRLRDQTLVDILGPDYAGQIADDIRQRETGKSRRGLKFFGRNTLVKLCSGDISYLIDMLGQMLRHNDVIPIKKNRQHRIIKQYAWRELHKLHDYPSASCGLHDMALNFGKLSLFKLLKKPIREGDGQLRPAEYLRIEVAVDENIDKVKPIIADLLRNGVFVDGGFSNSSQGDPARRLLFRKIFTPAFPTTYNSRDTFAMSSRRFLEFAQQPERFVRSMMAADGVAPEEQETLLDMLVEPIT